MQTPETVEYHKKCHFLGAMRVPRDKFDEFAARHEKISRENEPKLANLLAITLERVSAGTYTKPKGPPLCMIAFARGLNLLLFESPAKWFTDQFNEPRCRRFHRYLTALVDFVTRYKNNREIETMGAEWKDCRCDCSNFVVLQCHIEPPLGSDTIAHIVRVTSIAMTVVLQAVRLKNLDKDSVSDKWPRRSSDIIVSSALDTLKATKQSLKYTNSLSASFSCLTEQMTILPSLQTAVLQDSELLAQSVTHLDRCARYACSRHPSLAAHDFAFTLPDNSNGPLGVMFRFHSVLISNINPDVQRAYEPLSHKFYKICLRVVNQLLDEPKHNSTAIVAEAVRLGLFMYSEVIPVHEMPPLHPRMTAFFIERTSKPFHGIYHTWPAISFRHRCFNPGCSNTSENMHRPLRQCSTCKVIKYCSAECQIAAWKHPDVPHKRICKLAAKFTAVFPSFKDRSEWRKTSAEDFEQRALAAGLANQDAQNLLNGLAEVETLIGDSESR